LELLTDDRRDTTVADASKNLLETLRKVGAKGDVDLLREGVRVLAEAIMEAEVGELTGEAKGQRDPARRLTHRNGYRQRRWDTRVGNGLCERARGCERGDTRTDRRGHGPHIGRLQYDGAPGADEAISAPHLRSSGIPGRPELAGEAGGFSCHGRSRPKKNTRTESGSEYWIGIGSRRWSQLTMAGRLSAAACAASARRRPL